MAGSHDDALLLRVEGVSKRFGATTALSGVSLDVRRGEIVAVAGENGSGKSTLARIMTGAEQPDEGRMVLDGDAYAPCTPAEALARGVVALEQEPVLVPHLTVAENIALGVEPRCGPVLLRRDMCARARRALDRVGLSRLAPRTMAAELSAASRQLVALARALETSCRVLVLDEPTSSLGGTESARLRELLRAVTAQGVGILLITHDLEQVRTGADRCVVLRDGLVAGEVNVSPEVDPALAIVPLMVGRPPSTLYPRTRGAAGEVVLTLTHVAGARLPVDASLHLRRGEVLGIAGLVGSGRTECLRTIFGLDEARGGDVRTLASAGWRAPAERWREGIGMVVEERAREGLAMRRSVALNMLLPQLSRSRALGFSGPGALDRRAMGWIERLGIRCRDAAQPVNELSGGHQQRVALARLPACGADIYLLDEPTRGVDIAARAAIYALIDSLAAGEPAMSRRPGAVLLASSDLSELLGVCDRIAVMRRGRLSVAAPVASWSEESIMHAAVGSGESTWGGRS